MMKITTQRARNKADPAAGTQAEGAPVQFAIPSQFGQTGQIEIKAGPPDQNGVIVGYTLQTPAENSFVYNELSCDA